ncbi:hypothetical protein BD779DRAFT_1569344 [Infundibulicybe gibba]|nr:hypothetical protein BD779DRAFT_1569344 [Infundibulicybe gibba]
MRCHGAVFVPVVYPFSSLCRASAFYPNILDTATTRSTDLSAPYRARRARKRGPGLNLEVVHHSPVSTRQHGRV